jgi:aliphatic nitrilase
VDSQAFAQVSKAFVVSVCGTVDEDTIRKLELLPEQEKIVRSKEYSGGSVIVSPNLRIIAGPMGAEEGILYADCDLETCVTMKLRHDFAGHYNRPDIFQLHINRAVPRLYTVHNEPARAPPSSDTDAPPEPTKLDTPEPAWSESNASNEKPRTSRSRLRRRHARETAL